MESTVVSLETLDEKQPGVGIMSVSGHLDIEGASTLESYFLKAREQGLHWIIVSLADTHYVSSAGWGVFMGEVKYFREAGGDIKLTELQPDVLEIFNLMDLEQILKAYDTMEEVLEDVRQQIPASDSPSTSPTSSSEKIEPFDDTLSDTNESEEITDESEKIFAGIVEFCVDNLIKEGSDPAMPQNRDGFDVSEPDWLSHTFELIDRNGSE